MGRASFGRKPVADRRATWGSLLNSVGGVWGGTILSHGKRERMVGSTSLLYPEGQGDDTPGQTESVGAGRV